MNRAHIKGALVGVESVTPEGLKDVYKGFNVARRGPGRRACSSSASTASTCSARSSSACRATSPRPSTLTARCRRTRRRHVRAVRDADAVPGHASTSPRGRRRGRRAGRAINGIPVTRHWLIPQAVRPKVYIAHPVMCPTRSASARRACGTGSTAWRSIWKRAKCVKSLKARLAFVLISKLYRQMYANTGIATDSARVSRSARWARLMAKPCQKLFAAHADAGPAGAAAGIGTARGIVERQAAENAACRVVRRLWFDVRGSTFEDRRSETDAARQHEETRPSACTRPTENLHPHRAPSGAQRSAARSAFRSAPLGADHRIGGAAVREDRRPGRRARRAAVGAGAPRLGCRPSCCRGTAASTAGTLDRQLSGDRRRLHARRRLLRSAARRRRSRAARRLSRTSSIARRSTGTGSADYPDNARRFALLVRAALEFAARRGTAPVGRPRARLAGGARAGLSEARSTRRIPCSAACRACSRFTTWRTRVSSTPDWLPRLDLAWELLRRSIGSSTGDASASSRAASTTPTSSRRSARATREEIQTPEFGFGFDGILRARARRSRRHPERHRHRAVGSRRTTRICRRRSAPTISPGKRAAKAAVLRAVSACRRRGGADAAARRDDLADGRSEGLRPDRRARRRAARARRDLRRARHRAKRATRICGRGWPRRYPDRIGVAHRLRRSAGAPHRGGRRHVPDAVAVRALRPESDVQPALRHGPGRAGGRRPGRHRHGLRSGTRELGNRVRVPRLHAGGAAGGAEPGAGALSATGRSGGRSSGPGCSRIIRGTVRPGSTSKYTSGRSSDAGETCDQAEGCRRSRETRWQPRMCRQRADVYGRQLRGRRC